MYLLKKMLDNFLIQNNNFVNTQKYSNSQNVQNNQIQTYVQENNKDFILLKNIEKTFCKKNGIIQKDINGNRIFTTKINYTLQLKNIEEYFQQSSACCRKCFEHSYIHILPKELNNIMHTGGYIKTKHLLDKILNNGSYSMYHTELQKENIEKAQKYMSTNEKIIGLQNKENNKQLIGLE